MSAFSRFDRIIGGALLAVLIGLVALGIATRPGVRTTSSAPAASRGTSHAGETASTAAAPTPTTTTTTTSTSTTTTTTTASPPIGGHVTAVGDSVMIDIQPNLEADIPGVSIDGLVSRQFESGIAVVQADRGAGSLGSVLVIELGTNGSVTSADVDAMMQAAAGVKRVVFVNVDVPRSWEASDNAALAGGVARYPGVAVLADWYSLSSPHPEWFTADQVHLNPTGASAMATLIAQNA
jgi:hypothetical protein